MIMKKKFTIGMLLVLSLFMVACSNKKEEAQEEGKVLKVAVSEDTTTLEPVSYTHLTLPTILLV